MIGGQRPKRVEIIRSFKSTEICLAGRWTVQSNYQFRASYDVISRQIDVAFRKKKLALVYKYKIEHLIYAET